MNLQLSMLTIFVLVFVTSNESISYDSVSRLQNPTKFERQYYPRYKLYPHRITRQSQAHESPVEKTQKVLDELENRIDSDSIAGRIVGGRDAQRGELPYQLRYIGWTTPTRRKLCGATLVEAFGVQFGLTAAHCLHNSSDYNGTTIKIMNSKKITIVAGAHNVKNYTGIEQVRYVNKLVMHPQYNIGVHKHKPIEDIGIIFLKKDFNITGTVSPIKLPGYKWNQPDKVLISSWGWTNSFGPAKRPEILQLLKASVISIESCKRFEFNDIKVTAKQMCLLDDGAGACSGDSGGPAVARNSTNKQWYLAGVTTFRLGLCGSSIYPSIYARVSFYVNWIQKEVKKYKKSNVKVKAPKKKG